MPGVGRGRFCESSSQPALRRTASPGRTRSPRGPGGSHEMSALNLARPSRSALDYAVRGSIVALTLATGYIHFTLGGLLFLANAAGYVSLADAMTPPLALASRYRCLIRSRIAGDASTALRCR